MQGQMYNFWQLKVIVKKLLFRCTAKWHFMFKAIYKKIYMKVQK
jgi:hypothetical protein